MSPPSSSFSAAKGAGKGGRRVPSAWLATVAGFAAAALALGIATSDVDPLQTETGTLIYVEPKTRDFHIKSDSTASVLINDVNVNRELERRAEADADLASTIQKLASSTDALADHSKAAGTATAASIQALADETKTSAAGLASSVKSLVSNTNALVDQSKASDKATAASIQALADQNKAVAGSVLTLVDQNEATSADVKSLVGKVTALTAALNASLANTKATQDQNQLLVSAVFNLTAALQTSGSGGGSQGGSGSSGGGVGSPRYGKDIAAMQCCSAGQDEGVFANVEKVRHHAVVSGAGSDGEVTFPRVTTVGGDVKITAAAEVTFPELTSVGGSMVISGAHIVSFPKLANLGGGLYISDPVSSPSLPLNFKNIHFPRLRTIGAYADFSGLAPRSWVDDGVTVQSSTPLTWNFDSLQTIMGHLAFNRLGGGLPANGCSKLLAACKGTAECQKGRGLNGRQYQLRDQTSQKILSYNVYNEGPNARCA